MITKIRGLNSKGQSLLEFAILIPLTIAAGVLILLSSFYFTGWVWTKYWAYQSLHCLFEKNKTPPLCKRELLQKIKSFPGKEVVKVSQIHRDGDHGELVWSYHMGLGNKAFRFRNEWGLKRPEPDSKALLSRELRGF